LHTSFCHVLQYQSMIDLDEIFKVKLKKVLELCLTISINDWFRWDMQSKVKKLLVL